MISCAMRFTSSHLSFYGLLNLQVLLHSQVQIPKPRLSAQSMTYNEVVGFQLVLSCAFILQNKKNQ